MKIREIVAKGILTKSRIPGIDYSLNPYVGCGFGCTYRFRVRSCFLTCRELTTGVFRDAPFRQWALDWLGSIGVEPERDPKADRGFNGVKRQDPTK